jgi:membrane protein DedA with SNARE-associated domain
MGDWVVRLIEQSGYLGVGFLMFLETVFPPIPSEIIMPVAGVAAAKGRMSFALATAAGTTGAMLGNILWYLAARALGHDRLRPFVERYGKWLTLSWNEVERAHHWFEAHGIAFVLVGRLIPTVRSLVSIPAGLLDMRFRNFVIASTIGTAMWTALLTAAGYMLQENFHQIDHVIGPVSNVVLALLVATYLWRLFAHRPDPSDRV